MWNIRSARSADRDAIWSILEPVIRAGETYTLPTDMGREQALSWWFSPTHEVFVAEIQNENDDSGAPEEEMLPIAGTYFIRPNYLGGGSHVANCGYVVNSAHTGRGVARAMCLHSLDHGRRRGFRAMQFNFVVSANHRAVRLWQHYGFEILARLPEAFLHPTLGYVDAYVMRRAL